MIFKILNIPAGLVEATNLLPEVGAQLVIVGGRAVICA